MEMATHLTSQVTVVEQEKAWRTPSSSDGEGGVMEMREGCAGKYKLRDHVAAEEKKSWGTPSCMDTLPPRSAEALARAKLKGGCKNLREEVHQWATPRDQDHKHSLPTEYEMQSRMHNQLLHMQTGGKLNPRWVETLMGLPIGWTMPSCQSPVTIVQTSYDCLETESCQPQQNEHSELF
jgi:hypothetical protein